MIKEAYCSYEISKLLKEKGFRERICSYYKKGHKNPMYTTQFPSNWNEEMLHQDCISAPTHQMAIKWLREVHNKHCDIGYDIDLKWFFQIIDLKETVEYDYPETKYYHTENESGFNSYEDAVEAVLKYVLENLL